jgi:AcrR family transcriptional regulator
MRSDKGKAFILRRSGKSYREISAELGVAKSTLTEWFRGVDFSQAIRQELTKQAKKKSTKRLVELNRVRGAALSIHYELAEVEAKKEMQLYRHLPLFSTALALYWGEGDKRSRNQVRIINADPAVLQVFVQFLKQLCAVPDEKIRLALFTYEDLNEEACRRYWRKKLAITRFHKTQVLKSRSKSKRLPYGTCMLVVSDSYLKKKLQVWIDHLPEMVLNTVPNKKARP